MVVALVLAIIIMANVLRPLVNLIFPDPAEPPLPAQVELLEEVDDPRVSDGEWLYGTDMDGCALAAFYESQGSTCNYNPLNCAGGVYVAGLDPDTGERTGETAQIGICTGSKSDVVNSYSWEVYINTGFAEGPYTIFRVYLYRER
jgi:hypothetical protein